MNSKRVPTEKEKKTPLPQSSFGVEHLNFIFARMGGRRELRLVSDNSSLSANPTVVHGRGSEVQKRDVRRIEPMPTKSGFDERER